MPRRRPTQLRPPVIHGRPRRVPQVARVSAGTLRAIAELERTRLHPGAIAEALTHWTRFVRGPARLLSDYEPEACPCPCCEWDDPASRREALKLALHALPTRAARELCALVKPLDEIFLARGVPDPETEHIRMLLRE
jgi:hypothetical protein